MLLRAIVSSNNALLLLRGVNVLHSSKDRHWALRTIELLDIEYVMFLGTRYNLVCRTQTITFWILYWQLVLSSLNQG